MILKGGENYLLWNRGKISFQTDFLTMPINTDVQKEYVRGASHLFLEEPSDLFPSRAQQIFKALNIITNLGRSMPELFLDYLWLIIWILIVIIGILCFLYPFLEQKPEEIERKKP